MAAIDAAAILSPTRYSWLGRRGACVPRALERSLPPTEAREYLLAALQAELYTNFYCHGGVAGPPLPAHFSSFDKVTFETALAASNRGRGYWQSGWRVIDAAERELVVERAGIQARARRGEYRLEAAGRLTHGTPVSVRFPSGSSSLAPGFYIAIGNKELTSEDLSSLVRLYWNLDSEGALRFVSFVTSALNRACIPFQLKVAVDANRIARCDSVVLYLPSTGYEDVAERLKRVHRGLRASLRDRIPALTKKVAPGVGLAEDPQGGESFGEQRCRLIAEGLIDAFENGRRGVFERLTAVERRFEDQHLDLERPFLNPGSIDRYRPLAKRARGQRTTDIHGGGRARDDFLATAASLGTRLAREAIWHESRCTWLGAEADFGAPEHPRALLHSLGPDLYNGTAGIGLFLAELFACTGDAGLRRVAKGALEHSLMRARSGESSRRGLYLGASGVALVSAYASSLLGDEELRAQAAELVAHGSAATLGSAQCEPDLLSGNAGAIIALVILRDLLDDDSLLAVAVELADELLESAERTSSGYSWKMPGVATTHNLTGLSHGAAGIGQALAEVGTSAGEARYVRAAGCAFHYERRCFDRSVRNWPDFRSTNGRGSNTTFETYWCHGAPGIALSRLRAHELLADDTLHVEAMHALQTTAEAVEDALRRGFANYSLCHGVAGNADVLLCGAGFPAVAPRARQLAEAVGVAGIERYARNHDWPCGTGGGETPGLMLGLAGIGHFYLRLHSLDIPSVLIWRREQIVARARAAALHEGRASSGAASQTSRRPDATASRVKRAAKTKASSKRRQRRRERRSK